VVSKVYRVDGATLCHLDALADYPRLNGRVLIPTTDGATWVYHYHGRIAGRPVIPYDDWRDLTRDPESIQVGAQQEPRSVPGFPLANGVGRQVAASL